MFQKLISSLEKKFIIWYDAFRAKRIVKLRDAAWAELKSEALKPWIELGDKGALSIADTLLTNQISTLRSSTGYDASAKSDAIISGANVALLNISARVIKSIINLRSIVGVQPMVGPVGLAYLMTFKYGEKPKDPPDDTGIFSGRRVKLEIISRAMQAVTRKLQAGWSLESAQDLKTQHGLELEAELTNIIAQAIEEEIVSEILDDLKKLAVTGNNVSKFELFSDAPEDSASVGIKLHIRINQAANEIARKTRRGAGNFIVASPITISLLQSSSKSVFVAASKTELDSNACLKYVGTLNGTIKVYCSYSIGDEIIIGYKGGSGECDAGYFYGPYVPVMSSGITINPMTFQPVISMMTRYGKLTGVPSEDVLFDSSNYYQVIELTMMSTALPPVESAVVQEQELTSVLPPPSEALYDQETGQSLDWALRNPDLTPGADLPSPDVVATYQESVEVKPES